MSDPLASTIARVSATTRCRHCGDIVAPDVILCPCRVARGELPHTEWPASLKRHLCVLKVERVRSLFTNEGAFWERMLLDAYRGTSRGQGANRVALPYAATLVDCFPFAAGEAALWAASGYPVPWTI